MLAAIRWSTRAQQQPHCQYQRPQQLQLSPGVVIQPLEPGHTCETCGKVYKQKNDLWRHKNFECGQNPRFMCPYCKTYRTKQRSNMYTHIKHRHRGLKIYVIDLGPEPCSSWRLHENSNLLDALNWAITKFFLNTTQIVSLFIYLVFDILNT